MRHDRAFNIAHAAMDRNAAIALLDRLHEAQNDFYAGGSDAALQQRDHVECPTGVEVRMAGTSGR